MPCSSESEFADIDASESFPLTIYGEGVSSKTNVLGADGVSGFAAHKILRTFPKSLLPKSVRD